MNSTTSTSAPQVTWRKSIRTRLFLAFSALVVAVAIFIYLYFPAKFRDQSVVAAQDLTQTMAQVLAFTVSPSLDFDDPSSAAEAIAGARQNSSVHYVVVTNKADSLFAAFGTDIAQASDAFSLPATGGFSPDGKYWQATAPAKAQGSTVGYVRVGYSLADMYASIAATRRAILLLSIGIIGVGVLVVFYMARVFTKNLSGVVKVLNQVGNGETTERAAVQTSDEVGVLAHAFNTMLDRLDSSSLALRLRERQYRLLAENMNEGLVQIGPDHRILYANPKFCAIFGLPVDRVQGQSIYQLVGAGKLSFSEDGQAQNAKQVELEVSAADGTQKYILVSYAHEHDGDQPFINAIFTDISALKKTEQDLLYKNRELDTFVYKASHDLKAPLSSLRGVLNIAREELQEAKAAQLTRLMLLTVDKMDDVLQGLLEVTWVKQGTMQHVSIMLEDFVQTILRSIEHAPGYSSTEVILDIPPRMQVVCDPKMLNSILQNIIFNAIKYHREEGEPKWVKVAATAQEKFYTISIQDNGPGIPKDAHEKLFDMFFRASKKSQGSGLGLYIVKNSVEKLGGSVTLKSEVGQGTEFLVKLPVLALPQAAPTLSQADEMPFR